MSRSIITQKDIDQVFSTQTDDKPMIDQPVTQTRPARPSPQSEGLTGKHPVMKPDGTLARGGGDPPPGSDGGGPPPTHPDTAKVDGYLSRLVKYIPSEVIALYVTLEGILRVGESAAVTLYWAIFIFCLLGTWLWLKRMEQVKSTTQVLLSMCAFTVWVYAFGGPFDHYVALQNPLYPALLLPCATFLIPLIKPA